MTKVWSSGAAFRLAIVVIFVTLACPAIRAQDLGGDDLGDFDLGDEEPGAAASPGPSPAAGVSPGPAEPGDLPEDPGDPGDIGALGDPGAIPGDPGDPGDPGSLPGLGAELSDEPQPVPAPPPAATPAPKVVERGRFLSWIGKTVRRLDERQMLMRGRYDRGAANTLKRAFELRGIRNPTIAGYADSWGRDELSPAWSAARDFYRVHREALEKSARAVMARKEAEVAASELEYLEQGIRAWRIQEIVLEKFLEDLVQIYTAKAQVLEKVEKLKGERFSPIFSGDLTYEQRIEGYRAQADLKQSQADRLVARLGDISSTTRLFSPIDDPQRIAIPVRSKLSVEPKASDDESDPLGGIDLGEPGDPGDPGSPGDPGPGDPGDPADPGDPGSTGDPGDPAGPGNPGDPGDPAGPGEPGGPSPGGTGDPGGSDDLDSIDLGDDLGDSTTGPATPSPPPGASPGPGASPAPGASPDPAASPAAVAVTPPSGGDDLEGDLDLDPLDVDPPAGSPAPSASPAASPAPMAPAPAASPAASPAAPASPSAKPPAADADDLDIDLDEGDLGEPGTGAAPASPAPPAPASPAPSAAPSPSASAAPADADDMDIDLDPSDLDAPTPGK